MNKTEDNFESFPNSDAVQRDFMKQFKKKWKREPNDQEIWAYQTGSIITCEYFRQFITKLRK